MTTRTKFNIHPLLAGASIVIILAGVREIAPVLNIFLVALLLAVAVSPLLTWQLRRGWPKAASLAVTILIVIVIMGSVSTILGVAINNIIGKAPFYQDKIAELYHAGMNALTARGIDVSDVQQLNIFSPDKIVGYMTTFLQNIFSTFGNFFFVVLLMVFILIEFADITVKADRGEFAEDSWQHRFGDISEDLKKYVTINAIAGLIAAVADFVLLLIIGVDFAVLWGFLAFLFSFIPNIGFVLSVVPPALLALLEFGWGHCILVVVGYVVFNSIIDNVIKPRFLGKEFKMSILVVFLSLLFWGWLMGAIGAILGVPLTMAVKRIVDFTNKDMEADGRARAAEEPVIPLPETKPEKSAES
ncbi:MAG: AI-2E family transporter [Thermodesulfobacteriota bacterium]